MPIERVDKPLHKALTERLETWHPSAGATADSRSLLIVARYVRGQSLRQVRPFEPRARTSLTLCVDYFGIHPHSWVDASYSSLVPDLLASDGRPVLHLAFSGPGPAVPLRVCQRIPARAFMFRDPTAGRSDCQSRPTGRRQGQTRHRDWSAVQLTIRRGRQEARPPPLLAPSRPGLSRLRLRVRW